MRLIDAHALLTAYENAMKELVQATNAGNISLEALSLLCGAKLIAEAPTVGGWISVKDKLPGKLQNVLVSLVNEIDGHRLKAPQIGYHTDDAGHSWFIASWNEWAIDSDFMVTHWTPMPEGPKEEL